MASQWGNSENAEVTVMAMLPSHEGIGIGGKLLCEVENWLKSEGCKRIWLTTDTNPKLRAYGFYRKQGWDDWKIEHGLRYMAKVLIE
ncbi:MAG: GNAT family N-acetyltransferase [Pseudomonadales bacterium]|nr:GNAT family N-acetyltransferase [Pseudomonadales bacterium]